jgi:hypothetical protein
MIIARRKINNRKMQRIALFHALPRGSARALAKRGTHAHLERDGRVMRERLLQARFRRDGRVDLGAKFRRDRVCIFSF